MRLVTFLLAAVASACVSREPPPDRTGSPEAALDAARSALHRKDLPAFYDAMTESYVRAQMENLIAHCVAMKNPAVAARVRPWKGCEELLARYGWPKDLIYTPESFKKAAGEIRDPRGLVVALEMDKGTTYARDYLDQVKVTELTIGDRTAKGTATWQSGRVGPIVFEKDETGWRVNPLPEP